MRKLVASEWITLDGVFDGSTIPQWFEPYHTDARGEWIGESINSAGAFLLGRNTYEMLAPHWSRMTNNEMGVAAQLNAAPKFVVSSTMKDAPWNNSTIVGGDVVAEVTKLKQQSGGNMLIMGSGMLVKTLLAANLIDELRVLVQPIIFGKGKRLFNDGDATSALALVDSQSLGLGVMALKYQLATS